MLTQLQLTGMDCKVCIPTGLTRLSGTEQDCPVSIRAGSFHGHVAAVTLLVISAYASRFRVPLDHVCTKLSRGTDTIFETSQYVNVCNSYSCSEPYVLPVSHIPPQ